MTLTAPAAWVMTEIGTTAAMNDTVIDNRTGRSSVGTDLLQKTFRPGWNVSMSGFAPYNPGQFLKNWATRLDKFGDVTEWYPDGKPKTLSSTSSHAQLWTSDNQNAIDNTVVPPFPDYGR